MKMLRSINELEVFMTLSSLMGFLRHIEFISIRLSIRLEFIIILICGFTAIHSLSDYKVSL